MTTSLLTPPSAPATRSAAAHAPARAQVAVRALVLAEPLPGFPGHRDYVLVPAEDGGRVFWLGNGLCRESAPLGPVPSGGSRSLRLRGGNPEATWLLDFVDLTEADAKRR